MAQSGANKSLAGGVASAVAGNDFTSFAVRFRASNVSTDGFIWENSSEQLLMSLNGANGTLWTKGLITASAGITIPTTSSGYLTIRQRTSATVDPQIFMKSGGYTNYAVIGAVNGLLHGWTTSNSTGEPSGNYVYVPLNGNWTYTSDRRLKSDIKTLECGDCCEKLIKINRCSYYWKSDEKKEKKNHGFIADEVKKIFPEFVSESGIKANDGNGYLEGITYTSFIPILVSGFQHMAEKVVNLEKENKNLMNILQDQANQRAEIRAVVFPPNA